LKIKNKKHRKSNKNEVVQRPKSVKKKPYLGYPIRSKRPKSFRKRLLEKEEKKNIPKQNTRLSYKNSKKPVERRNSITKKPRQNLKDLKKTKIKSKPDNYLRRKKKNHEARSKDKTYKPNDGKDKQTLSVDSDKSRRSSTSLTFRDTDILKQKLKERALINQNNCKINLNDFIINDKIFSSILGIKRLTKR
jgi:hypothetical protein